MIIQSVIPACFVQAGIFVLYDYTECNTQRANGVRLACV